MLISYQYILGPNMSISSLTRNINCFGQLLWVTPSLVLSHHSHYILFGVITRYICYTSMCWSCNVLQTDYFNNALLCTYIFAGWFVWWTVQYKK